MAFPPNPVDSLTRIPYEVSDSPTLKIKQSEIPESELEFHMWFRTHAANLILSGQFRFIMYVWNNYTTPAG